MLKIISAGGEFLRECLDTHGRIMTLGAIIVGFGGGAIATAAAQTFAHLHGWSLAGVGLLATGIFVILAGIAVKAKPRNPADQAAPLARTQAATLSTTAAKLNPKEFFATAYISSLTDEAADNIRNVGAAYYPNTPEREEFYVKFIGVGVQAYVYEQIWWLMFRSQLVLLKELNQRVLDLGEVRPLYDAAERAFSQEYSDAKETFDLWLGWLRSQILIVQEGMKVAITPRGRDFLKYLVHTGKSEATKRL